MSKYNKNIVKEKAKEVYEKLKADLWSKTVDGPPEKLNQGDRAALIYNYFVGNYGGFSMSIYLEIFKLIESDSDFNTQKA